MFTGLRPRAYPFWMPWKTGAFSSHGSIFCSNGLVEESNEFAVIMMNNQKK